MQTPKMIVEEVLLELLDDMICLWNENNIDELAQHLDEDCILDSPGLRFSIKEYPPTIYNDKAEILQFWKEIRAKFPLDVSIEDIFSEDGKEIVLKTKFYKLNVLNQFECSFTTHAKLKYLRVTRLEETNKILTNYFIVGKNLISHYITSFLNKIINKFSSS